MHDISPDIIRLIEKLNQRQLHTLYHFIGERLNLFEKTKALYDMQKFHIHDRVSFNYHGVVKKGIVLRLNQRTISVLVDDGTKWKVSPDLLRKVVEKIKN